VTSEIEDRRQRAREAAQDAHGDPRFYRLESGNAVEAAVEVATQVKITDEAIEAFGVGWHQADARDTLVKDARRRAGLAAALAALGFEVVD
jgi:hypothetical protein